MSPHYTLQQFITAINSHSIAELGKLMTGDHAFIDAHNNTVQGRDKMTAGWQMYFHLFPDYRIEV